MKKFSWKIFNIALWCEVILAYLLPFEAVDKLTYQVGFPVPFLSIQDGGVGFNLFSSMGFNPIGLVFNVLILYVAIGWVIKRYGKYKENK